MSVSSATSTVCTVWPLMSMPRILAAFSFASSGVSASFTPPALPRPPVFTCALITTSGLAPGLAGRELFGDLPGLIRGTGHLAVRNRDAVLGEQLLRLVLEQVHSGSSFVLGNRRGAPAPRGRKPSADRLAGVSWVAGAGAVLSRVLGLQGAGLLGRAGRPVPSLPSADRTQSTISVVVAPGVKIFATPICSSSAMSASGMIPPPNTVMSVASRSRSSSSTRLNWVMCAPDRIDKPIASASSCRAADTICSGV